MPSGGGSLRATAQFNTEHLIYSLSRISIRGLWTRLPDPVPEGLLSNVPPGQGPRLVVAGFVYKGQGNAMGILAEKKEP